jgi:alanine racemase
VARWAWAEIDLDAVEHNVRVLRAAVAPAEVWAVVKADGYGHGAARVASAAQRAGATGLCVALASEGVALRDAGIGGPVLVLSEQPDEELDDLVDAELIATAYTPSGLEALAARRRRDQPVHLKIDTGMRRVGAATDDAAAVARRARELAPWLALDGVFTHLAMADAPSDPSVARQLAAFDTSLAAVESAGGPVPRVHAANSAAALAVPASRRTLVRTGIAVYGISPGPGVDHLTADLRPAMSLRARVSFVKRVRAGDRISYGLRHRFERDTNVATVPIGYADGVPRRAFDAGAAVLVGGRRRRVVGVVTMDQLMVDVGDDDVRAGDEVVLMGTQGRASQRAEDWASVLGTIGYEVVCAVSARVPRVVRGG